MSISACSVNSGTVALASAIRRAMTCWVRLSSCTRTSPLTLVRSAAPGDGAATGGAGSAAGVGSAAGGAGSAGAAAGATSGAAAASTSALTIRPPGPVPVIAAMSTPRSRAMRRATGDAFTRSPAAGGASCVAAVAAPCSPGVPASGASGSSTSSGGASALGAGAAAAAGSPPFGPPSPIRAITSPIGRVAPSAATMPSTPSWSAS